MRAAFANKIGNGSIANEKLKGWNDAAGNARNETLGENALKRAGQLSADLRLLTSGERVNNTVNGLWSVVGM